MTLIGACSKGGVVLDDAQRLYAQGDLNRAIVKVGTVLEKDALNAEALLLLGRILVDQGDGVGAERELRKAMTLGIGRDRIDRALAKAMLIGGQHERLLEEIKPSADHKGEVLAGLLASRGMAHLALGQFVEAREAFGESLKTVPDFTEALLAVARLHYLDGNRTAASALVERVLARDSQRAEAWLIKAELAHVQGQLDHAVEAYEEAARLAPTSVLPRLAVARILIGIGRLESAQGHLDSLARTAPNHPMVNYAQALLHFHQKNFVKAQEAVQATLKVAPRHAPAVFLLAGTELAQGAVQQAEARFRRIVQEFPNDLFARKLYAATLLQMNEPARAIEAIEPLLQLAPSDVELLSLAGQAHMQARRYAQASAYLERAAAQHTDRSGVLLQLGLMQLSGGEHAQGLAEIERAVGMESAGIRADLVLALAQLRVRSYDKALLAARTLEKKQPANPIAHNLIGAVQLGKGDRAAARASFTLALTLDPGYLPAAINLAQVDVDEGRAGAALQRLEGVLARDGENVDAMILLARLDRTPGSLTRLLEAARAKHAQSVSVRLMLVRQHLIDGNHVAAVEVAQEAIAIAPDSADALDALGAAQLAAGQRIEALATYQRLATLAPNAAGTRYRLAQVYAATENLKSAEAEYRKTIGLKPDHAGAMMELARLYASWGQFEPAIRLAADLKTRLPKSGAGEELMGDLLVRQKRYAEAVQAYDSAYTVAPSGALAVKYHGTLKLAGKGGDSGALGRLDAWIKSHPEDIAARHYLADRQLDDGATAKAIENYRAILKLAPTNAFVLNNLANAYLLMGDPMALETAATAYKLRPDHPQIADTFGWLLTRSGQAQRGLPLLRQAAAANPDSPDVALHLAIAMAKTGDRDGARALVKRLLDLGKDIKLDAETRALLAAS